jgi:PPOX class probable F420-dependent enzyme
MCCALTKAKYVNLATFRKNAKRVATPVWCAENAGVFYVFSAGSAGKIKRLRNSDRAQLAVCDARGKLLGDWHDATAVVLCEPADIEQALSALRNKYGFGMWLADVGAKLTGRFNRRAYIGARLES